MMHDREKSDPAIVATKPANKAGQPAAESVERRAGAKGNANQQSTRRAQDRESVSQALERVRKAARQRKKERFTALFHHLSPAMLRTAFLRPQARGRPGVDGLTWQDYEADLDRRIEDLHARVQRGAYRALPSPATVHTEAGWPTAPARDRRSGRQDRPEGDRRGAERDLRGRLPRVLVWIPAQAQPARCAGRPGGRRSASTKVNYILDADIRSFFDEVSQEWLIKFLNHRIGDPRIIRLIQKWLKAGVLEDEVVTTQ